MNHLVCTSFRVLSGARLLTVSSSLVDIRCLSRTPVCLENEDHNHDFRHSEELAKERYDIRAGEDIEKKRARLLYQSRKRGMLENGVILASFADKYLHQFDATQLDLYDRLINLPTNDWDIFYWATKTKPTPPEFETSIMHKLREHLRSKVSNNDDIIEALKKRDGVLGKTRPDDVIMPAVKSRYDIDIDPMEQDLVNYKNDLFDYRRKSLPGRKEIVYQTDWRRRQLEKRVARAISRPVSLRNMNENKKREVFTQREKNHDRKLARRQIFNRELIDSHRERLLKHHSFVQDLMKHKFTDNADQYDEEVEAWSDMIWHRNYGTFDKEIAISEKSCISCHKKLHCCDPGLDGYVPKEILSSVVSDKLDNPLCQRCNFYSTFQVHLGADVSRKSFERSMEWLRDQPKSIVVLLIDLADFPSGIYENIRNLMGTNHHLIIVGNKLDLIPYDASNFLERIQTSLRANISKLRLGADKNMHIYDTMLISARTGFGVEGLIARIHQLCETPMNVYIVGSSNSGKSTLFSALLQSDLSAVRKCDLVTRITPYLNEGAGDKFLKFPIDVLEGWQVALKNRRRTIVERDTNRRLRSLENLTKFRQETMPHLALLSNRLGYHPYLSDGTSALALKNEKGELISTDEADQEIKLSDDHPFNEIEQMEPFSATEEKFKENAFCYYTPSAPSRDQIYDLLTPEERLEVYPSETIMPRQYNIRPLNTILIAGLARLDLLTSTSFVTFTIFASKHLPIHVLPTRKADQFYTTFLGSAYLGAPFGDQERMSKWPKLKPNKRDIFLKGRLGGTGIQDICLSSVGWALVSMVEDQECLIRAYTPEARGIHLRNPPLLRYGNRRLGKTVRDTPLFRHPYYDTQRMPA